MIDQEIEDVYSLSPMQEGMLFHTLYSGEPGAYLNQQVFGLPSDLNITAFERAWRHLVQRHSVLRTSFHWEGLPKALQLVQGSVDLPIERLDWHNLSDSQQQEQLDRLLKEHRLHGIELSTAPLMRLTLIRIGTNAWQFLWTVHHLLLDRWSSSLLLNELRTAYAAICRGQHIVLPRVQPYGDYIGWLQEQDTERAEGYWRRALAGFTTATSLPIDRAPGRMAGKGGCAREHGRLSEEATSTLQALARQYRVTLNTVLQGAWALLLSRYSGEEDVLFGTTVSGRPPSLPGVESMVGLFINSLPVRVSVPGSASVIDWLQDLQGKMLEMREYEYSSLVQIQGWSETPRGIPLFESLVIVQNTPGRAPAQEPGEDREYGRVLELRSVVSESSADFPLFLLVVPGAQLNLWLSYDVDRYDGADIVRLLGHLVTLLEGMIACPQQRLCELSMLTRPERHQILQDWNQTQRAFPDVAAVHHLFEQHALAHPDAIALVFEDEQLTYHQLNVRANQLAHLLQHRGVIPDQTVGLCLQRGVNLIVAMLGILKAGGAYLPMEPTLPQERLCAMLHDSHTTLWVSQTSLGLALPGEGVLLDAEGPLLDACPTHNPLSAVRGEHLVYVIYTSGSTGRPKGVGIEHRNLLNYVFGIGERLGLEVGASYASVSTLSADLGHTTLFGSLCHGGCLHLIASDRGMDALGWRDYFTRHRIDCLKIVGSHLSALLGSGAVDAQMLPVKALVLGGEACRWELVDRIRQSAAHLRVLNHYGPTETTVGVLTYELERGVDRSVSGSATVPLGRALGNSRVYVLNAYREPVPVGVVGELYIGGSGVGRGYVGRPELTSERFLVDPFTQADPFSEEFGSRLYRTGDQVRYLSDGSIEFLGRVDHQVKIRGYRIELGEIESVLLEHGSVREAVVLAREDQYGDKRLVAYVVGQDEALQVSELAEHIHEKLPEYMVPTAFMILEALPLTSNGKVDRKALPTPEISTQTGQGYAAPRTPIEEGLVEIWCEILHVGSVGVHDSFFALGGHSLLATQMISRIRNTFQVELPLRALFEAPILADLAERIEQERGTEIALAPPMVCVSREGRLPLSFSQQRLWFLNQYEPESTVYNIPRALRLTGALNVEALQQSLQEIVRRHEALRTTFTSIDSEPAQVIHEPFPVRMQRFELGSLSDNERTVETRRLIQEEGRRAFDLACGPLLRTSLLRLAEEEHILLLTVHHIVSDGWSQGVLRRELATLYNAYRAGRPSPLQELPIQYADYAAWQREWLQGETLHRQIAYWKERLAAAPALLELPTDRPRPPVRTFRGAIARRDLSAELTEGLKALGQQEGTTLFMTLLAAFAVLLSRYSGQEDIVVGTPIANRTRAEVEGLIGFFLNTLALRTDVSGDPSFVELLGRVREVALGAYAHQDLPFEKLVEELSSERSLSHSPVFQVLFTLQNAPGAALILEGLQIESVRTEGVTAKFDLSLAIGPSGEGLRLGLEYNTDLFDDDRIEQMLGHFQTLLQGIVADPEQPLSRLTLLTDAERRHLLVDFNHTQRPFPDRRLHQLVEDQADRSPEARALSFEATALSYRQLDERANQLAHTLRTAGVGAGAFVGVALERSIDLVVSLLAVLKAGAAYLPIDLDYPAARIASMLQQAHVGVILSREAEAARLPQHTASLLLLDRDAEPIASQSVSRPNLDVDAEAPAYLIYTSGSTGMPKGVVVAHRAIQNHMQWMAHTFPLSDRDRVLLKTPVSFDACVWESWGALMAGAQLVVARPQAHTDPTYLVELIHQQGITTLKLVPSLLQMLLEEERFAHCESLRQVFCGAETLPRDLQDRFLACFGERVALHNLYGPTEAAIDATGFTCRPGWERGGVPIGRPISNVQAYVLDRALNPAPIGVPGELYLGGASLATGYLNASDLTAERFVPDPFGREAGGRLYRTGDWVRYLWEGDIEFLGRIDQQVKVRGMRIELGEIESVLLSHASVREAVVVAREDVPGDTRLVAYLVAHNVAYQSIDESAKEAVNETVNEGGCGGRSGDRHRPANEGVNGAVSMSEVSMRELREQVLRQLPAYMLPSAFVVLPALPRTASGKLDRKALPAPQAHAHTGQSEVQARTPIEEGIAQIWGEVLHTDRIGVTQSFFELGGHSLLATQVISRVRATFQVEVPLRALFETPTIAGLAEQIQALQRLGAGLLVPPLTRAPRDADLPLSFSQQRLWFVDQLQPGSSLYNVATGLRLRGVLELHALQRALEEIFTRHEVLRTRYADRSGNPLQVISQETRFPLPLLDLSELAEDVREEEARRLCREEARRPFDLANDAMMRAQVLRLEPQDHLLLLTLHHIASDGWSRSILMRELSTLYNAFASGQPSPLPALAVQYADYAAWQRSWLQGEALQRQVDYWHSQLSGAPRVLELPTDRPRESATSYEGAMHRFGMPKELSEGLKRLCHEARVTPFMALLAALKVLLYRWTGQPDLVVGTDVANRTEPRTEGLIGFFLNHLVLRTQLRGDPSFRELLGRVREVCLGAYAHQDLPFDKLVEVLQPERRMSHTPVFQVLFVVQNVPVGSTQWSGLSVEGVGGELGASKFELSLFVGESGEGYVGAWVYRTDLFEAGSIRRLSEEYLGVLGQVLGNPDMAIEDVELVSKAEERKERTTVVRTPQSRGTARRAAVVIEAGGED